MISKKLFSKVARTLETRLHARKSARLSIAIARTSRVRVHIRVGTYGRVGAHIANARKGLVARVGAHQRIGRVTPRRAR